MIAKPEGFKDDSEEGIGEYLNRELKGEERRMIIDLLEGARRGQAYAEGKTSLDVRLLLPDGATLEAFEDKSGIAHISVRKESGAPIDFDQLLSPGYKFVTPRFLIKHPDSHLRESAGFWGINLLHKVVSVGDMRDPTSVFSLLHEIGHSHQKEDINGVAWTKDPTEMRSINERDAWAYALKTARKIRREHGVDLFKFLTGWTDLKRIIYGALLTHRYGLQYKVRKLLDSLKGDNSAFRSIIEKVTDDDLKRLKTLFDKAKFSKPKYKERQNENPN